MVKTHTPKASELLFPMPRTVEDHEGFFRFHDGITIAVDSVFKNLLNTATTLLQIRLGGEDILVKQAEGFSSEGYSLSIGKTQVVIKASEETGAFRGISTLRNLSYTSDHRIPCCFIEDSPSFSWRGFMIDCSRHYFSPTFLKKLIDIASLYHLNRFHWHLSDDQGWRIPLEGWPELEKVASKRTLLQYTDGRNYGRLYTKEEILDIQAYAHARYMVVVPEIETPGHVSSLLAAYPQFGCSGGPYEVQDRWGIFDEVLCAGNDKVLEFLEDAITQMAALFSDPYIHIGGDECPHTAWESCPKCQKRMQEAGLKNEKELQSWMTSNICAMVSKADKRPIGWDEVLEGTESLGLPQDLIVMSWRGVAGGIEASERGHEVIMCPNTDGCYFDYQHTDDVEEMGNLGVSSISQVAQFDPLAGLQDETARGRVLGSQGNLWTEKITSGKQAEYLLFPRLMVLAERLWNPQNQESTLNRIPLLYKVCDALSINCYRGPVA
jgi:hexosaminidase